jgi:hypothetical protein
LKLSAKAFILGWGGTDALHAGRIGMTDTPPVHERDAAFAETPTAGPHAPWRVASVKALKGYRLWVRFRDGLEGIVEMGGLIASPRAGLFAALADTDVFDQASVHLGAVTWPDDLDIAPHAIHRAIKSSASGVCALA